ncbi:hypothetical protein [Tellurirhabdus rosea]|uniref:hypothetical protein n=1 Tax=Tellurirhabdus rosea TaxID=2674997 RepID=UPI00224DC308|nr:hypothetical protein [Tellurirhabdus rosea]
MSHTHEEENTDLIFRELFPPEEARFYTRPVRGLPTERIAYWSIAVSVLLAGALVTSWFVEKSRPVQRSAPSLRMDRQVGTEPVGAPPAKRKPAGASQL